MHWGLSAACSHLVQLVLSPLSMLRDPTCQQLGLGAGMDGTEPGLNHHPQLNQKINPHHSQFRKILSPSKIHENTSNALDIPFVIIPGEL